jgi:hypothetical protein
MDTGVAYFGNRMLRHVEADLEDIAAHDCTYVVHTFSEEDQLYYTGTMKAVVRATQNLGMQAWIDPWGVGGLFAGEALSLYAARFPNHQQVLSTGAPVPAVCPNWPEFRAWLRTWVDAALEIGADVLLWDEPHFAIPGWYGWYKGPSDAWACRCAACQYLYRQRFGEELPLVFDAGVRTFRQERLLDFLADMTGYAAAQGATNTLCVLPFEDDAKHGLPWRTAVSLPDVHVFGADPYWISTNLTPEEYVGQKTARVVETCHYVGKPAMIWVQAFNIPEGRELEVATAIEVAASGGADYIAAWGYNGCGHMSSIASARPDLVWETIGRAYRQLVR